MTQALEFVLLGGEQFMEALGERREATGGLVGAARARGDGGGVEIEPRAARAFRESKAHVLVGLRHAPGTQERPCRRVVREDVGALAKLRRGQSNGGVGLPRAGREEQRKGARVAHRAVAKEVVFHNAGPRALARAAQGVGQGPLIFGQRNEARGGFKRRERAGGVIVSEAQAALEEKRRGIV